MKRLFSLLLAFTVLSLFVSGAYADPGWWDVDWRYKRVVVLTTPPDDDLNRFQTVKAGPIDVSGWGLTSLDEIRVINDLNNWAELDRNIMGSITSTDLNIYFVLDQDLTKNTLYDDRFFIYYGNDSAGVGPDSNKMGCFDTFETADFNFPWWTMSGGGNPIAQGDTVQSGTVKNGAYAARIAAVVGNYIYTGFDANRDVEQEFSVWMRSTNVADAQGIRYALYSANFGNRLAWIAFYNGWVYNADGAGVNQLWNGVANNIWYYVKIVFNSSTGNYDYYIFDEAGALQAEVKKLAGPRYLI